MKLTLTPLMLCLDSMKIPNRNRSVLNGCRYVLGLFWVKFQSAFGIGLVLRNFCIKEMLGFRGDVVKIFQNPCFCLSNLVITHPYLVIQISK